MEEEAKLEFTITVNWRREDGSIATTQLETLDRSTCRSAEDVGLQLADAKPILGRLQEIVVSEQMQRHCEAVRPCPRCHRRRHLKDYRCRRFDRSAGKSIIPVLSPNRLSEWWWESMAHSLKQGILGRAKGISLRFSPGASRLRSSAARHSPWCGIRMQRGGCKPFSGAYHEGRMQSRLSKCSSGIVESPRSSRGSDSDLKGVI
jgi:hypothetical protein